MSSIKYSLSSLSAKFLLWTIHKALVKNNNCQGIEHKSQSKEQSKGVVGGKMKTPGIAPSL